MYKKLLWQKWWINKQTDLDLAINITWNCQKFPKKVLNISKRSSKYPKKYSKYLEKVINIYMFCFSKRANLNHSRIYLGLESIKLASGSVCPNESENECSLHIVLQIMVLLVSKHPFENLEHSLGCCGQWLYKYYFLNDKHEGTSWETPFHHLHRVDLSRRSHLLGVTDPSLRALSGLVRCRDKTRLWHQIYPTNKDKITGTYHRFAKC